MKKFFLNALCCALALVMCTAELPHLEVRAASNLSDVPPGSYATIVTELSDGTDDPAGTYYVSEVVTAHGANRAEAEAQLREAGYFIQEGNLNEDVDGDYVCLGFKVTDNREEALTSLRLMTMNGGYEKWDYRAFLADNVDGLPYVVDGMMSACRMMKALLDAGNPVAKAAYDTLNIMCVPATSQERTGEPLGSYLLSPDRTADEIETLILVLQGSTLTFVNSQLAVGCSSVYVNSDASDNRMGWVSTPEWLDELAAEIVAHVSSDDTAKNPDSVDELIIKYASDIDALTLPSNFEGILTANARGVLQSTKVQIIYNGVEYESLYDILTFGERFLLASLADSLPASIPAAQFGAVVVAFADDPDSKIPGSIPALPEIVSPVLEKAADYLNKTAINPFTSEGTQSILDDHKETENELSFFLSMIQDFVSEYRKIIDESVRLIGGVDRNLTFQETMIEYSKLVEKYNTEHGENEQYKSDMLLYIGPYEVLRSYRFAEKDFLTVTDEKGNTQQITDLGAYFECIADTAEKNEDTAKALVAAVIDGFTDADLYLAKTTGLPLFLMDAVISPADTERLTNQYEESKGVLVDAFAKLGYAENECTVWVGTNKDMLETEYLARTDATIRACEEDNEFSDQLLKAQADKHEMDFLSDAMEKVGIAMAAGFVVISLASIAVSVAIGEFIGMGALFQLGLLTLMGSGSVWGLGMVGMIAAVAGLAAIILVALLIIAFIVILLILLLKKKKAKKEESVERTAIPTIMMDCTLDVNNQNIKYATRYDVVRDLDGSPADLNANSCTYWNALYASRSDDAGSPLTCNDEGIYFALTKNSMVGPEKSVVTSNFGYKEAYNLNARADTDTTMYLHFFTYNSINGIVTQGQGAGKYIESITMAVASRKDLARSAILRKNKDYVIFDYDFTPHTDYYTYIGYSTTDDPAKALTDIRASQGTTSFTMQWGDSGSKYVCVYDSSEVSCPIKTPSSETIEGDSTHFVYQLYTCKSEAVGDPILTSSLKVVKSLNDVPDGYEYVRWFSGGAFDFIAEARDKDYFTEHRFLCYAPEESQRHYSYEPEYLAGFGFFSGSTSWLGTSAANLEHSAEDMGFHLFGEDLTPNAMHDEYDKTYIGYATTHNPKKAITDIGVFTSEPDSKGYLPDTIVRAGEFFASCVVFQSGDKGYSDGNSLPKVRSIRTSHAYITAVEDEADMCNIWGWDEFRNSISMRTQYGIFGTIHDYQKNDLVGRLDELIDGEGWRNYNIRSRGMYVCGPREGVDPILISDVVFSRGLFDVPTANGMNMNVFSVTSSSPLGKSAGTGWKSVHALDQYFYDEYDANDTLVSAGSNLGCSRTGGDCNMYLFFRNNTPNLTRGKFIKSIEIVGSDDKDTAFDTARLMAMGAGEEIINLSSPLFSDPLDRWDLADDSAVYSKDDKAMDGYAKSCTFIVVSYQSSSSGSVGEVRIAYQDGRTELPTLMSVTSASGSEIKLYKGKYVAPIGFRRGESADNEKTEFSKGYVIYTSTSGEHIGHVSVMENGETGYDSSGYDYRFLSTTDDEIFAPNGGLEQAIALYNGTVSAYISGLRISDTGFTEDARTELRQQGFTQFIVADLMAGNSPKRYHIGISRTSMAAKAIKDIRIVNELLPTEKDASGNELLLNGQPYAVIDGRSYTLVNEESLTLYVEGSEQSVYIYTTIGNTLETGKARDASDKEKTKDMSKYPERVAITNLGLKCVTDNGQLTTIYWNGVNLESPITTLPNSMTTETTVLNVGGVVRAGNGYEYLEEETVLNGDSYRAATRFGNGSADWYSKHGTTYLVYTTNSGLSMTDYAFYYEAGLVTGNADKDAALGLGTLVADNPVIITVTILGVGLAAAIAVIVMRKKKQKASSRDKSDE